MTYGFNPDYVVPTSEVLREWLDTNHLTTKVAAVVIYGRAGSLAHVKATAALDAVLNDGPVNGWEAAVLAHVTGTSPQFWLAFEHNYRTGLAAGKTVSR